MIIEYSDEKEDHFAKVVDYHICSTRCCSQIGTTPPVVLNKTVAVLEW